MSVLKKRMDNQEDKFLVYITKHDERDALYREQRKRRNTIINFLFVAGGLIVGGIIPLILGLIP